MRVIQDSDDEFDDLEASVPPPKQTDRPNQQLAPSQSGTGSTESLKRAVQKAHHDCLQFQDSQNEVESSKHVFEPPGKRRKTSAESTPVVGLLATPLGNSLASLEVGWNLEGTIRDNYAIHDPMAMFPEPSSTVPNATLTQQRVMEEVMAPVMLGGDLDHELPRSQFHPEPSVPWSDMIQFSPPSPAEQAESSSRGQMPEAMPASSNRRRTSQEKLSESFPALRTSQEEVNRTPSWKEQNIPTLDSEDDLADVDLPKEQYKPRPSRSRSLKASVEQPIDYSIRPERAARASKRRNAKDPSRNAGAVTTPQKIKQICDMGFTPSTTERALTQNNGDVMQTVDWLVSNGIGEDELAPHGTPNKRVLTTESTASASTKVESDKLQRPLDEATERQKPVVSIPACPTVQVVIRQTPPKRRKTTLDEPESEPLFSPRDQVVPVAANTKKRGRGRPKKAVPATVATDAIAEVSEGTIPVPTELDNVAPESTAPDPKDPKLSLPHGPQHHEHGAADKAPPTSVVVKEPSHSSTSGKVPYRVGLSKRARIAPLLRTLKKCRRNVENVVEAF